ncbi:MAG: response regulator transcription factor [Myxococcales bacterium]|nr:response regulator transcription factor [Myxococcales bacterium]
MIRVILIDDHPIFRIGVAHFLAGTGTIEVVGQADDGIAGLGLAERVAWDVAVVDLALPRLGGTEVVRRLRAAFPARRIVALSHFPGGAFDAQLRDAGADAFVSKVSPPEALVEAIEASAPGAAPAPLDAAAPPHARLTARELQVFQSLLLGRSTVEIAAELAIAASTVSNHVAQIKAKLGVSTVAGIVTYAHRAGLIA